MDEPNARARAVGRRARTTFKAYRGKTMVLSVWTDAPGAEHAERAAFQRRLNRGELTRVDVSHDDPKRQNESLTPQ